MKRKKIYISVLIATIIFMAGCSGANNNKNSTSDTNSSSQTTESKPVDPKEITELIQEIQSESEVLGVNASRSNDTVTADITFKNDADSKKAKDLAKKYVKKFKDVYKSQKANINIIQDGKNIANAAS